MRPLKFGKKETNKIHIKMANKNIEQEPQINVATAVSKTEKFLNENKKTLIWVLCAIVVLVALGLIYQYAYSVPRTKEAVNQAFTAEMYFADGEFDKALNGDENAMGLAEVIKEYGGKAPKAVYFEAGVCALQLGEWDQAISYLNKYNGKDPLINARAIACKGDAYSAKEDYKKASDLYMKAANTADNVFAAAYLLKAGVVYEKLGHMQKALDAYNTIKVKYPQSVEAYDINKYIERISK